MSSISQFLAFSYKDKKADAIIDFFISFI